MLGVSVEEVVEDALVVALCEPVVTPLSDTLGLGIVPWVDEAPCDADILAVGSVEAVEETLPPGVIAWESVAA